VRWPPQCRTAASRGHKRATKRAAALEQHEHHPARRGSRHAALRPASLRFSFYTSVARRRPSPRPQLSRGWALMLRVAVYQHRDHRVVRTASCAASLRLVYLPGYRAARPAPRVPPIRPMEQEEVYKIRPGITRANWSCFKFFFFFRRKTSRFSLGRRISRISNNLFISGQGSGEDEDSCGRPYPPSQRSRGWRGTLDTAKRERGSANAPALLDQDANLFGMASLRTRSVATALRISPTLYPEHTDAPGFHRPFTHPHCRMPLSYGVPR